MQDYRESTLSTNKSTDELRVLCVFMGKGSPFSEFAEACMRWTPQVAVGEEAVFLEVGKCRHLYNEERIAKGVLALAKRFEIKVSLAFAEDIPTSLAMARYHGQYKKKSDLPIEILNDYLSPFRRSHELDKMIVSLKLLGVNTLGEFAEASIMS